MAISTGFRLSNGVEVGATFAARASAARAAVGLRNSAGADLSSLLEPLHGSTAKVGPTGFRMSNGVDINLAFDTTAGNPQNFAANPHGLTTGTAFTASLSIGSDGSVSSTGNANTAWFSTLIAGLGAGYDVKFTKTAGTLGWGGVFDTWQSLSTTRVATMQVTTTTRVDATRSGSLSISIRDANTLAVVCTGTANFSVEATGGAVV